MREDVYNLEDPCDLVCSYFDCGPQKEILDADRKKLNDRIEELADKVAKFKKSGRYSDFDIERWEKEFSEELEKCRAIRM
jgi:hypothetical protein